MRRKVKVVVGWGQVEKGGSGVAVQDIDEQGRPGDPIWVRTRSSHCSGPFRWISIQLGVLVTVCRLHNATQHSKRVS